MKNDTKKRSNFGILGCIITTLTVSISIFSILKKKSSANKSTPVMEVITNYELYSISNQKMIKVFFDDDTYKEIDISHDFKITNSCFKGNIIKFNLKKDGTIDNKGSFLQLEDEKLEIFLKKYSELFNEILIPTQLSDCEALKEGEHL